MRSCQGSVLGLHSTGAAGSTRDARDGLASLLRWTSPSQRLGSRQSFLGDRGYMQMLFARGVCRASRAVYHRGVIRGG